MRRGQEPVSFQPPKPTLVNISNISSDVPSIDALVRFLQKNSHRPIRVNNVEHWDRQAGKARLLIATKSMALALEELTGIIFYKQKLSLSIVNGIEMQVDTSLSECPSALSKASDDSQMTLDEIIRSWLFARYDQTTGYLNLAKVHEDKELSGAIEQLPASKRPLSTKICLSTEYWANIIFSNICIHISSVTALNLASNSLQSLSSISGLLKSESTASRRWERRQNQKQSTLRNMGDKIKSLFSKVRSLSLSDNNLTSLDEIMSFISQIYSIDSSSLSELLISGNPVMSSALLTTFPPTPLLLVFFSFIFKFKKLSIFEHVNLDVIRNTINNKSPFPSTFDPGLQDALGPFLQALVAGFDSSDRTSLHVLYSTHPETRLAFYPLAFSERAMMSINNSSIDITILSSIWSYIQKSLLISTFKRKELFLLGTGESGKPEPVVFQKSPEKIYDFLSHLPGMKHATDQLSVLAFNSKPLFVPEGEIPVIQIFFSGLFYEGTELIPRSFVRNLVIIPGNTLHGSPFNFSILFDDWYLATYTDFHTPQTALSLTDQLDKLTPMKKAIVTEFSKTAKLSIPYALKCLEENGWRVLDAQEAVRILKVFYDQLTLIESEKVSKRSVIGIKSKHVNHLLL